MADKGIYLKLEIDDKGTPTIKNVDAAYAKAMQNMRSSTDVASRVTDGFSGKLKSLAGSVFSLTTAFVALTGSMAVMTARYFVNAFTEQERASNQLANAMKNAGTYSEGAYQDLLKYSQGLQMSTRYSDEQALAVMNMMQTYGSSVKVTKWATSATLDFATALGMDTESAARYVGMALQGNIDMLARYIPALKGTVTKELETASAAEKVAFFIELMNEKFGGRAQAEMTTYGSKIEWLKNMYGELEENIVGGIIKSFEKQGMTQDDTAKSFKRLALVMVTGAEVGTKALLSFAKVIAAVGAGFDILWTGFLKLEEYTWKAALAIEKLTIAYANWRNDAAGKDLANRAAKEMEWIEGQLKTNEKLQENSANRIVAFNEVMQTSTEGVTESFGELRDNMEKFGNVKITPPKVDKSDVDVKNTLSDAQQKKLDEYKKASIDIDKAIYASTHSLYESKLYQIENEVNEYKKAGIEKERLDKYRLVKTAEFNRERLLMEKDLQDEITLAQIPAEDKYAAELTAYRQQLDKKLAAEKEKFGDSQLLQDNYNALMNRKRRDVAKEQADTERAIQLEIIDAVGTEQEKAYAHFVAETQDKVKVMKEAGMTQVEIQEYVNAKVLELQEKQNEQLKEYWEGMATDIKAALSDTFSNMLQGEGDQVVAVWEELWSRLQKSYSDMVTEQFSGLITKVLQSEAVGGLLDKMGLGGFAKAWEETSTPPALKILDTQYDLQKEQHNTQIEIRDAVQTLSGNKNTNLDVKGIFGSGGEFDFDKLLKSIMNMTETKAEQPITTELDMSMLPEDVTDFSSLTDEVNMCSEATGGFATSVQDAAYTAEQTTSALSQFGTKLKGFFGTGGVGSGLLGMVGGGMSIASTFDKGNYKGDSRWSGAAKGAVMGGMGGFGVGLGIQSLGLLMGVAGPWGLALGAIIGAVGGFLGGQTAEKMEKELKRAEDYMKEFKDIAGTTYDNLTDMVLAFDETLEAKNIYAMEWLDMITSRQAQVLYAFAEATTQAQNEAKATASVSGATFDRMTLQLKRARAEMPEFAEDIGKIQTQMEKLYKADVLDDFATGILRAQNAIESLVRGGMSQLAAQTELFGKSYNEIMLLMNGSIPVLDSADESFNDLRKEMSELQASIDELPDTLQGLKDALNDVMYGVNYLINTTQSVVKFTESFTELPDIFTRINEAEDFKDIAQALQELENVCTEAMGTFAQLADIFDYIGAKKLGNVFTEFAEGAGYLTALVTVIRMVVEAFTHWDDMQIAVLKIWRNFLVSLDKSPFLDLTEAIANVDAQLDALGASWEDMMNMFDVWQKQLDDMNPAQLFDELIDKTKEWQEILYKTKFGSLKADMYDLLKDFTFALMTIEEIQERARETNDTNMLETANKMESQLREAFVEKVEEYFDAIIDKFELLGDKIRQSIYSIEKDYAKLISDMAKTPAEALAASQLTAQMYRRMFDDVSTRLTTAQSDLAQLNPVEDPEEYLEKAEKVRDLIVERYDLEMTRIQELIDEQQNIKDAYQDVVDTVEDALVKLKGEGSNPQTAKQRLGYYETEAQSLRDKIANAKTPEEAAGYQSELVALLQDYLGVAEDAYQRPSAAYKAIYDSVIAEISAIGTDAQTKVSTAEAEIIRLQGEQKTLMEQTWTELALINGKIESAKSALESQKEIYKQIINESDVGAIADWFEQNSLPDLTTVEGNTGDTAANTAASAADLNGMHELFKTRFPVAAWWTDWKNRWGVGNNQPSIQSGNRVPLGAAAANEQPEYNVNVTPPDVTIDEVTVNVPQPKVTIAQVRVDVPVPKVTVSQVKVTVPQPKVTIAAVKVSVERVSVKVPTPIVRIAQVKVSVPTPIVRIASVKATVPAPIVRIASVKVTVPALKVEMPAAAFKALSTGIGNVNAAIRLGSNAYLKNIGLETDTLKHLVKLPTMSTQLGTVITKLGTVSTSIGKLKLNPTIKVESAAPVINFSTTNGLLSDIYNRIGDMSKKVFGVPLAAGIEYVPRDNYFARLHKGEAVLTAEENRARKAESGGGNTINFTVNVQGGGDAKSTISALKKEIRYGTLGMVINERVKNAS